MPCPYGERWASVLHKLANCCIFNTCHPRLKLQQYFSIKLLPKWQQSQHKSIYAVDSIPKISNKRAKHMALVNGTFLGDIIGLDTIRKSTNLDDVIFGSKGDDSIFAAAGIDFVSGGADDDTIYGADGDDQLFGNSDKDYLDGGNGNDYLDGGNDTDTIYGRDGDDQINGGFSKDFLFGGMGNDEMLGSGGDDIMIGEQGDDTIVGGFGSELIDGGVGQDNLLGGGGNDRIIGDGIFTPGIGLVGDNDTIVGSEGDDTIYGGFINASSFSGNDDLDGGNGNDLVIGWDGNDTVIGSGGNDNLVGHLGDDTLIGVNNASTLPGAFEIDTYRGDLPGVPLSLRGKDTFVLGNANYVYYNVIGNSDFALITDFQNGLDKIRLKGAPADYTLSLTATPGAPAGSLDTRIFFGTTTELIGIVSGVGQAGGAPVLSLTNSTQFVYI
jgi:Ca2+-binding RTX toxin-like protein